MTVQHQSILFEMLRSFTTLARTLNLSQAVRILGTTRQTLRRHIDILEDVRGEKFFEVKDRQYYLTDAGKHSLAEAETILERGQAWLSGQNKFIDGLAHVKYVDEQGIPFYSQQHPVTDVWNSGLPLLQKGLQAWVNSRSRLDHPAMEQIKPYLVLYRKRGASWLCVGVGEKSSVASWLGADWAKSAIGYILQEDPMSSGADQFIVEAYNRVSQEGNIRLDHIYTFLPRQKGGKNKAVLYHRLLFACTFPDGKPAIATFSVRTNNLDIPGLNMSEIAALPDDEIMDFDI